MKRNHFFIYFLNGFSLLWLLLSIFYCLLLLFYLITGKDAYLYTSSNSQIGNKNIFKDGYPVPATLSLKMPADTIVEWGNGNLNLTGDEFSRSEIADSILADTAIKKQYYFSSWVVEPGYDDVDNRFTSFLAINKFALFDTIVNRKNKNIIPAVAMDYSFDTHIILKSEHNFQNLAFALYSFIAAISMLLISFNVYRLFYYIKLGTNFISPLYKKVFNIGIILVVTQVIKILLSLVYAKWYGAVRLEKVSSIPNLGGNEFIVQFNPSGDFSGTTFLFGLSLIVLASLLKYGNKLEKENALTI